MTKLAKKLALVAAVARAVMGIEAGDAPSKAPARGRRSAVLDG